MGALAEIGVKAHYVPLNDIASEQGNIGGAAQRRFAGGVLLHHVTMSYDIDANKMGEVMRIGKEKLSDKGTRSAVKRRSEEHTSELQSRGHLVCRLLLEKKKYDVERSR